LSRADNITAGEGRAAASSMCIAVMEGLGECPRD
jgi:hypothetical protein